MTPTQRRYLRLLLGVALSGGALWLALRRTSPGQIGDALDKMHWGWIPAMIALKAAVLVIKDLRWRVELAAMAPGPYRRTFRAIGLGYFGNMILPFKLGEVLRAGLLKRHNPEVGVGAALATIGAERALDGAILAVMVGAVLPYADVPPWVFRGTVLLLVVMLGVIVVGMLTPVHRFFLRVLPAAGLLGWARRVVAALSRGTAVLRTPRGLGAAAALTALAWVGESAVFYCGVQALEVPIGYAEALVVTLLMSVGLLVPSAPGQLGTHQALAVLFLEPFGVLSGVAISLSIVLQAVALTTLGSIGGYVLIREAGARELVADAQRTAIEAAPLDREGQP